MTSSGPSAQNYLVFASVLESVLELYEETADLTLYRWDNHEIHVATAQSTIDSTVTLLFTLGSMTDNAIFVSPTDGDPKKLGGALAQVEAHFAKKSFSPHYWHVASIEHPYLAERGRLGMVTMSPLDLKACTGLPETIVAGGRSYGTMAVVWLDRSELTLATEDGVECLQRQWLTEGRDYVGI